MLAIRLPPEAEEMLERLSQETGRSKDSHALQALLNYLENWEDARAAEKAIDEFVASDEKAIPLSEVKKRLG
jgi:predicted DNA-binding protein